MAATRSGSAALAGASLAAQASAADAADPNILNHNPKMTYRPLGKTGFRISEVSLGGHGGNTVEDRVPVLEKAVELQPEQATPVAPPPPAVFHRQPGARPMAAVHAAGPRRHARKAGTPRPADGCLRPHRRSHAQPTGAGRPPLGGAGTGVPARRAAGVRAQRLKAAAARSPPEPMRSGPGSLNRSAAAFISPNNQSNRIRIPA